MEARARTPTSPSPSPEPQPGTADDAATATLPNSATTATATAPGTASQPATAATYAGGFPTGSSVQPPPPALADPNEVARAEVEARTRDVVDALYQLAFCVTDVQPEQEGLVGHMVNSVLSSLGSLSSAGASPHLTSLVPDDVLTMIDAGRNPDIHTRSFVNRLATDNQQMASQVENLGRYAHLVSRNVADKFPELADELARAEEEEGVDYDDDDDDDDDGDDDGERQGDDDAMPRVGSSTSPKGGRSNAGVGATGLTEFVKTEPPDP